MQSLFNHMLGRKVIFVIKLCRIHALKWKLNWLSWFNNLELHILNPNAALPKSEIEFFEIVMVSVNVITCSPDWDQYNHFFDLLIVLVINKCLERGTMRFDWFNKRERASKAGVNLHYFWDTASRRHALSGFYLTLLFSSPHLSTFNTHSAFFPSETYFHPQ